jgi:hypothetical protein
MQSKLNIGFTAKLKKKSCAFHTALPIEKNTIPIDF